MDNINIWRFISLDNVLFCISKDDLADWHVHEKSLVFMREKKLTNAIRCSLENFGAFDFEDKKAGGAVRHVQICPLYAISQIDSLLKTFRWG